MTTIGNTPKDPFADLMKAIRAEVEEAAEAAAAAVEAGSPPIRDITQSATIQQEPGGSTLIQVEGKSYVFTPSGNQGGAPGGGELETVALNGTVGVIEPIPDEEGSPTTSSATTTAVGSTDGETSTQKTTGADVLKQYGITPAGDNVVNFQAGNSSQEFLSFEQVEEMDKHMKEQGFVFVGYHGTSKGNVGSMLNEGWQDTGTRAPDDPWRGLYVADDADVAGGYLSVESDDPKVIMSGATSAEGAQLFRVYVPAETAGFYDVKNGPLTEDLGLIQGEAAGADLDNVLIRGMQSLENPATETFINANIAEHAVFLPSSIQFDEEGALDADTVNLDKSLGGPPEYQGFGSLGIGDPDSIPYNTADISNYTLTNEVLPGSGNSTAVYTDPNGDRWVGKQNTGLGTTVKELAAQKLAYELLGPNGAPETILASDGTLLSKMPAGESMNLESFFEDPNNLGNLSDAQKQQTTDSFTAALSFKIITGDADIQLRNFVIDMETYTVMPIDGEGAFTGVSADFTADMSQAEFDQLINDPKAYVNDIFQEAGLDGSDFIGEKIDPNTLLTNFAEMTNEIYGTGDQEGTYPLSDKVRTDVEMQLNSYDQNTNALSNNAGLAGEIDTLLGNIDQKLRSSVVTYYDHTASYVERYPATTGTENTGGLLGGSRITETETFHDNDTLATKTSSQNGAETLYEEFDENGNQTLKRETTHQPGLVDGKAVPLESSTYDFPNGTERIVSKTQFSNGVPDTKTDYVHGTEESFGDNIKLEIGSYREETQSKFVDGQPVKTASNLYDADNNLMRTHTYDAQGILASGKEYTYYEGDRLATETELDAEGSRISEQRYSYNAEGNVGFTSKDTYNEGKIISSESQSFDPEGTLVSSGSATYDTAANLASSTEATYDATGNVTSTTNYTFAPEGHILNEVAFANGIETMSTYDTMGALTATGTSVDGQWNDGVRVFGDDGSLSRVDVYANGAATGASYDAKANTFTGVNFEGVMSTNDLTNFDSIVNSMREEGSLAFFDHPDNAKYGTLIETLDFVQAAGLPIDAIENFDLTKPTEFTLNADALKTWADQLDDVDPNARAANSATAIEDFKQYINLSKLRGVSINGARTVGWFLTNVIAGDTADIADLGKGLYNFAKNFDSSKIFGKTASNVTPDFLNKTITKTPGLSAAKGASAAKFLGPVVAVISVGLNLYSGITGYKEAKENGAGNAELAYWVFAAMGGGPGGGICAAVDAKQKGYSDGVATKAFFAGLFGMYDPNDPDASFHETVVAAREEYQTRVNSRETLANLDIPANPATGDPGFNGREILNDNPDGDENYDNAYNWKLEDAFYDYMSTYHSDSPSYVPRMEGINGQYVGVEWQWAPGEMPIWGTKEGVSAPITDVDDLARLKWTDQPVWSRPDLSQTGGDWDNDGDRDPGPGGFGCWVAREVYGENNPNWLAFREWLVNEAPSWFRKLYFSYGPQFADFIKDKPWLKTKIRAWMDTKIDSHIDFDTPKYVRLIEMYQKEKMASLVSTEVQMRDLDFKSVGGNVLPSI